MLEVDPLIKRFYEQHFEGWQHRVKHRLHTANNKAVRLVVSNDGVMVEKKWDKTITASLKLGYVI